jgi:hypothetical protein
MYKDAYPPIPVSTCTPLGMYEGSSSEKARLRHKGLAWRFFEIYIDFIYRSNLRPLQSNLLCNGGTRLSRPSVVRLWKKSCHLELLDAPNSANGNA